MLRCLNFKQKRAFSAFTLFMAVHTLSLQGAGYIPTIDTCITGVCATFLRNCERHFELCSRSGYDVAGGRNDIKQLSKYLRRPLARMAYKDEEG